MANNNPEMSLDEVLSSIKKMVIDTEPPVLDLTDMVSENGDIVKVKSSTESQSSDMGSFLKMIQENEQGPKEVRSATETEKVLSSQDKPSEFLRSIATPLIREWIDANLSKIVKEIAEREIKKLISRG